MENQREETANFSPSQMREQTLTVGTTSSDNSTPDVGNAPRRTTKRWGAEEDRKLAQLVENTPAARINWPELSRQMENRTGKQCRERYINSLKTDGKKGHWTEEEDETIIRMQAMFGNKWSKIASCGFAIYIESMIFL